MIFIRKGNKRLYRVLIIHRYTALSHKFVNDHSSKTEHAEQQCLMLFFYHIHHTIGFKGPTQIPQGLKIHHFKKIYKTLQ